MNMVLTLVRNRGELAEGWYDPATLQKAKASTVSQDREDRMKNDRRPPPAPHSAKEANKQSDEDEIGPAPFIRPNPRDSRHSRSGPAIPSMQDLELRRGQFRKSIHV